MFRLIQECSPAWVIAENVAGHVRMGLDDVLLDLENEGYTSRTFIIPACAKGYPHRRDRVWIVANSNGSRLQTAGAKQQTTGIEQHGELGKQNSSDSTLCGWNGSQPEKTGKHREPTGQAGGCDCSDVADAHGLRFERADGEREKRVAECSEGTKQRSFREFTQPPVCRRDDGIRNRVDRIKALGNAVVPQIPEIIGRAILAHYNKDKP